MHSHKYIAHLRKETLKSLESLQCAFGGMPDASWHLDEALAHFRDDCYVEAGVAVQQVLNCMGDSSNKASRQIQKCIDNLMVLGHSSHGFSCQGIPEEILVENIEWNGDSFIRALKKERALTHRAKASHYGNNRRASTGDRILVGIFSLVFFGLAIFAITQIVDGKGVSYCVAAGLMLLCSLVTFFAAATGNRRLIKKIMGVA